MYLGSIILSIGISLRYLKVSIDVDESCLLGISRLNVLCTVHSRCISVESPLNAQYISW